MSSKSEKKWLLPVILSGATFLLLLWYFYLWFLYGSILVGRYFTRKARND